MTLISAEPATTLAAVVAARDETAMVEGCLRRLRFADEVVVAVDDRTTDDTAARAHAMGATVHVLPFVTFAQFKNEAIARTSSEWILVVDADERVTSPLAAEIRQKVRGAHMAYRIPIENYFYAGRIRYGGWREAPIRLFPRQAGHYTGDIHEALVLPSGMEVGRLANGLAHLSHRSVADNLAKTRHYAELQAREMLAHGHPRVTWRTFARVIGGELTKRLVAGRAYRDGMPGIIESLYQPFSMFCVYARLWELQQQPTLEERYAELDRSLP